VDRGHQRRGREPRALDRGGAATEQPSRRIAKSGIEREPRGRVRVRVRDGRAVGARGLGREGTGLCRAGHTGAGRAVLAHVSGFRPRHGLLHWVMPARAHLSRAGPGLDQVKKNGPWAGLTGSCFMYNYSDGYKYYLVGLIRILDTCRIPRFACQPLLRPQA
jgi:hypothetical protein